MSGYFERHRAEYVAHMLRVSQRGAWTAWLRFFLRGVTEQCNDAVNRAKRLVELRDAYKARFESGSVTVHKVIDDLCRRPAITIPMTQTLLGVTPRGASLIIQKLVEARVLSHVEQTTHPKIFIAEELIAVIEGAGNTSAPE
ncbi:MAG: hypothetical protein KF894_29505 [Labilithrix sp.]|nr:hypothetical protein [Labilithrix sp.]